jgi:hypothetical protein
VVAVTTLDVLLDEVRALRHLVERLLPPPLEPRQQALFDSIVDVLGGEPFSSAELINLSRSAIGDRRRLRDALQALGVDDDVQRLGLVLGDISKRSAALDRRLLRLKVERGARLWQVVKGPQGLDP